MSALAPLLGDKQTSGERVRNDAIDPKRTNVVTSADTASARLWEIAERYSSGMPAFRRPSMSRSE